MMCRVYCFREEVPKNTVQMSHYSLGLQGWQVPFSGLKLQYCPSPSS